MSSMTIRNGLYNSYSHLSSGKRINSAADDASGLAIAKKMQWQETGLSVGAQNAKAGIGVLNVADGALSGVTDYLQRIRELALKSMNGTNSASDKEIYQSEINHASRRWMRRRSAWTQSMSGRRTARPKRLCSVMWRLTRYLPCARSLVLTRTALTTRFPT